MDIDLHIVYADADRRRAERVTSVLRAAGFTAFACSGTVTTLSSGTRPPDIVLLHPEIDSLSDLARRIWPECGCQVVEGTSRDQLLAAIARAQAER